MDGDAILHPRGPELPSVYWRRRLVLLGVVLIVLILLFKSCGGGGSPSLLGASGTPTPSTGTTPSGEPSTAPSTSASAGTATTGGDCADADLKIEGVADKRTYEATEEPKLTIRITNTSAVACKRDIGQEGRELLVYSGADRVWSNRDCNPAAGKHDVRLLQPGEKKEFSLTWTRTRSAKGCPTPRPKVSPGTYQVRARLGSITVRGDVFSLRGPATS